MRKLMIAVVAALTAATVIALPGCFSKQESVVVYVSEDQVFSEPILKDFERETGITVKSVFDTEESKSTGVMNRLIAEKGQSAGRCVLGERAGASGRAKAARCVHPVRFPFRGRNSGSVQRHRITIGRVFPRAHVCFWLTQDRQSSLRA